MYTCQKLFTIAEPLLCVNLKAESKLGISHDQAFALAEWLETQPQIRSLDLSACLYIEPVKGCKNGYVQLLRSLRTHPSLKYLELTCCNPVFWGASPATLALGNLLAQNETLSKVNLWNNGLADEGTIVVAEMMRMNSTLRKLELGRNNFGDEACASLSKMLEENHSLHTLSLYGNDITDFGAAMLANGLKRNLSLEKLDVAKNRHLGPSGRKELLKSFNGTITFVDDKDVIQ
jgi:Ran GTPase-activating protein (RanGAP) involved in mRNA processing and transport